MNTPPEREHEIVTMRCRKIAAVLTPIAAALVLVAGAFAPNGSAGGGGRRPYRLPPNLLAYFKAKYVHVDDNLIVRIQETPDGPLGQIDVYGRLVPPVVSGGTTPEDRARAVAQAFMTEEAVLLDIADPAEIKESSLKVYEEGNAVVHYVRYIGGLDLVETYFTFRVDADGAITNAHATLVPVPSDLYSAVKRETITKDEVVRIIERDLRKPDRKVELTISEPGLHATWRPPYVFWGAIASGAGPAPWAYTIDAFTGEIVNKLCTGIEVRRTPGHTPCD